MIDGWIAYQDVGVEGADGDGAVSVDLEPDTGVNAVEKRAQEEPHAEEARRDRRPEAPPRHRSRRSVASAAVLQRVACEVEEPAVWVVALAPRGVRARSPRGGGGAGHGDHGKHVLSRARVPGMPRVALTKLVVCFTECVKDFFLGIGKSQILAQFSNC
jgi:hypothetical protein